MTSDCKFMFLFGLSGPKLVLYEISAQYLYKWLIFHFFWSQILRGTFGNFVAMATAQNLTNWFDLQNVSLKCMFKVRKFQLDTLSRFRMVEEKQGACFAPPPPGKLG